MYANRFNLFTLRQAGASSIEMIVGYTLVTFLILGLLQTSFVYNAKMHLDQATFEAARAGAVNNGLKAPMQRAFERNLIGLYGGGNDSASINHSWALARADRWLSSKLSHSKNSASTSIYDLVSDSVWVRRECDLSTN